MSGREPRSDVRRGAVPGVGRGVRGDAGHGRGLRDGAAVAGSPAAALPEAPLRACQGEPEVSDARGDRGGGPGVPGRAGERPEGLADLRLVPPALAVWGAAAISLGLPGRWVAAVSVMCAVLALTLLAVASRTRIPMLARPSGSRDAPRNREAPGGQEALRSSHDQQGPRGWGQSRQESRGWGRAQPEPGRREQARQQPGGRGQGERAHGGQEAPHPRGGPQGNGRAAGRARLAAAGGAVLLCAAGGAAVAGLHGADVRRGPVPVLAREYVRVDADVRVTSDPRATRPAVRGSHSTRPLLLLNAEVTEVRAVQGRHARHARVRTPVLLMVAADDHRAEWRKLLPSTRLRLSGRLSPPAHEGERLAAVLRVEGEGPPRITGPPTWIQRAAGELRAGLREATDGLDADARALLPGLVVGDTSRVPPELHEAFKATDLTHLLSVSGANLSILLFLLVGPPGAALSAERRGLAPVLGLSLRTTAVIGGAMTLAFIVVCRPEPSVLRAAACGLITLLAIGTGRRRSLIPALAAAVVLLVLYDPWLARSYGFLLSVLATGALLTIAPRWSLALRARRVPGRLAEVLAAAAAAQAVCAPVVVVLASRVSLVAVPCNLLAEFAVAPATVLGFAALAVAPVAPPVAELLARVAGWPVGWIATVALTGAGLPGAEAQWPGGGRERRCWPGSRCCSCAWPRGWPAGPGSARPPDCSSCSWCCARSR
ncbi:hypothetical protein SCALM49S_01019 [Streptomyces californicus]